MRSGRWLALIAGTAVLVTGCGGGGESDEDKIRNVVEDYNSAVADKNGSAACELLTADAKRQIADLDVNAVREGAKGRCESSVKRLDSLKGAAPLGRLKLAKVGDVRIRGDTAQADVRNSDPPATATAELTKSGDDWVISSAPGF